MHGGDAFSVLAQDPSRKDIAWKLGIDADVLAEDVRLVEVRNWISKMVLPYHKARIGK
jgi:GMP synthase (glutamine-hydrolysing)